ncbi:hypothetical protein [Sanguibacter sp. A246]|uniref:hypothetical protein n=1 Tax=Sanguibacter sp. A246 TaxID=3457326 RepID=UPI003FD838FF
MSTLATICTVEGRAGMAGCGRDDAVVGVTWSSDGRCGCEGRELIIDNSSERPWTSREEDGTAPWGMFCGTWRRPRSVHPEVPDGPVPE